MDVSLIFGIIFTIILISVILVFGGGVIADFFGMSGQAQVLKSIDNLGKKADELYRLAGGSSEQFKLSFSKDYKLCFFNSSDPQKHLSAGWDPDGTVIYRIKQSGYNTWYYQGTNDAAGSGVKVSYLRTATADNFCVPGGSTVYLTNRGDYVSVEPD